MSPAHTPPATEISGGEEKVLGVVTFVMMQAA